MNVYYKGQVLWAQIDANQHMRHTAYADFAAQARLTMLESIGLKLSKLYSYNIGPVLFREELIYLREIGINEYITVTCEISKARPDGSRWSIHHDLYRGDGEKAAIIVCDGAWIDMEKRKLAPLPPELIKLFMNAPRSRDYVEEKEPENRAKSQESRVKNQGPKVKNQDRKFKKFTLLFLSWLLTLGSWLSLKYILHGC